MMINDILYFYALHADPLLIQRIQPSPLVIIDKPLIVTTTEKKRGKSHRERATLTNAKDAWIQISTTRGKLNID
jgi:hypothetical protein